MPARKDPPGFNQRNPTTTSSTLEVTKWEKHTSHREGYWYDIMDDTRTETNGGGDPIFQALLGQFGDPSPLALNARHLPLGSNPSQLMYPTALAATADATNESFLNDSPKQVLDQFCD
jgi:hypothetical protein